LRNSCESSDVLIGRLHHTGEHVLDDCDDMKKIDKTHESGFEGVVPFVIHFAVEKLGFINDTEMGSKANIMGFELRWLKSRTYRVTT